MSSVDIKLPITSYDTIVTHRSSNLDDLGLRLNFPQKQHTGTEGRIRNERDNY